MTQRITFEHLRELMNGLIPAKDAGVVFKDYLRQLMDPLLRTLQPGYWAYSIVAGTTPTLNLPAGTYGPIDVLVDKRIDTELYDWDPATATLTVSDYVALVVAFRVSGTWTDAEEVEIGLLQNGVETPFFDDAEGKNNGRSSMGAAGCLIALNLGETLQFVGRAFGASPAAITISHAYLSVEVRPVIVGPGYTGP